MTNLFIQIKAESLYDQAMISNITARLNFYLTIDT